MLGKALFAIYSIYDKWLWKLFIIFGLFYCLWLYATAIDAHLTAQMNLWERYLGM